MIDHDFQLAWHVGDDWPEWGSRLRKPLVRFDGAHQGEWLDSIIGPDVVSGKPMVFHVVRCEICIGIHVWPLPNPATLAAYYQQIFYEQTKPEYLARYEADRPWWEQCVHDRILDTCRDHLRLDCPEEERVRLLDIGAGPGIAADCARRRGWDVLALEPSGTCTARLRARGHCVWAGPLETFPPVRPQNESRRDPDRFHIVYAYEVLEHQPCPEDFVLRCHALLEPDGLLALCVPNDWNPLQLAACQQLGLPYYFLAPPQHLFYWTPKTLQLLLRRCGFVLVEARGTYPMERFLLSGANYVGNETLGRACHRRRMIAELDAVGAGRWPALEYDYRQNLAQRLGREIVCIARKM